MYSTMKKLLYTFLLLLSSASNTLFAIWGPGDLTDIKRNPPKAIAQKAQAFYQAGDYSNAYEHFLALSQVKENISKAEAYKLGKSALQIGQYEMAVQYLYEVKHLHKKYKLVQYEYASALKFLGDYDAAIIAYQQYFDSHKDDKNNPYLQFALDNISLCKKSLHDLQVQALGAFEGQVVENHAQLRAITTTSIYGYKLAELQDVNGTKIVRLNENNEIQNIHSSINNAAFRSSAPSIAPDGETVYFTRPERNALGQTEHKIYMGKLTADANVVNIQKLEGGINRIGYSSLQPTAAIVNGQEVVYFSSSIPGGNGGFDIWYAIRIKENLFTQAYHTGMRLNSPADEITPFYFQACNELFFSSNRQESLGGFDVFKLAGSHEQWLDNEIIHLPAPINSKGDDYFYRQDNATNRTYLTTNRLDGKTDKTIQFRQLLRAQLAP